MISLVIGGSASGKSEYAEKLVTSLEGRRIYIATMQPFDSECLARIEKHRKNRAGRGFETVERYTDLSGLALPEGCNVLLECMSNLMANEAFSPEGGGLDAVIRGFDVLSAGCRNLTVVTNEVFSGGLSYEGDTLSYLKDLAAVNRYIAAKAENVIEVLSGCPDLLKGEALI